MAHSCYPWDLQAKPPRLLTPQLFTLSKPRLFHHLKILPISSKAIVNQPPLTDHLSDSSLSTTLCYLLFPFFFFFTRPLFIPSPSFSHFHDIISRCDYYRIFPLVEKEKRRGEESKVSTKSINRSSPPTRARVSFNINALIRSYSINEEYYHYYYTRVSTNSPCNKHYDKHYIG